MDGNQKAAAGTPGPRRRNVIILTSLGALLLVSIPYLVLSSELEPQVLPEPPTPNPSTGSPLLPPDTDCNSAKNKFAAYTCCVRQLLANYPEKVTSQEIRQFEKEAAAATNKAKGEVTSLEAVDSRLNAVFSGRPGEKLLGEIRSDCRALADAFGLPAAQPVTSDDMRKAIELGQSLELIKDEIDSHISYKNGKGEFDDMADIIYVNQKMKAIANLEYLGFNRNDELSVLRTKSLSEWEGTNEAWELISRFEGFLEKRSKRLFYVYRTAFIAEKIHATIQETPERDISTWMDELTEYLSWVESNVPELQNLGSAKLLSDVGKTNRFAELVQTMKREFDVSASDKP